MYIRKEAVLSSQIEGTQASLMDVLEFEASSATATAPGDVGDVVNYLSAMKYGLERLKVLPLSLRLIREIHAKLLEGVRGGERTPGEFRRSQNWIGPAGCALQNAAFVPPPPGEMETALADLEIFLHSDAQIPYLIKAGLAHAQFETIHPFLDGNGRVGRLLIAFLMCQENILQRPLLYISYYFKQHRTEYYSRLQAVRDEGDWEGWLKFFLRGVYEVAQEATATARRVLNLREEHRAAIQRQMRRGASTALRLLEALFHQPVLSIGQASAMTGNPFAGTNQLVEALVQMGLLREMTGRKRNRLFAYDPYLALYRNPGEIE
jgi:Fic family protein